ncbi:hypothetical protein [Streptomyces sp. NPDC048639]|uniref:hypothetical protein n=1 Tax=Streptomyces sp. NPDC048639 TaxID=3365581 RepID=UPI003717C456
MSNGAKVAVGGVAIAIVLLILGVPLWGVLLVLFGVPAVGYLLLDPSQRRRLRRVSRKELRR